MGPYKEPKSSGPAPAPHPTNRIRSPVVYRLLQLLLAKSGAHKRQIPKET